MATEYEPKTVGHAIDGIEEFDNPLPRWWLMLFYVSIVIAVVYWFLYPSWFGEGILQWSQHKQYEEEISLAKKKYPEKTLAIADLVGNPESIAKGKEVFAQNCAACHGPEAKGLVGPNLTDETWLYGGKPEEIVHTVTNGTAKGMPTWKSVLGQEKIGNVASFVYSLSHSGN